MRETEASYRKYMVPISGLPNFYNHNFGKFRDDLIFQSVITLLNHWLCHCSRIYSRRKKIQDICYRHWQRQALGASGRGNSTGKGLVEWKRSSGKGHKLLKICNPGSMAPNGNKWNHSKFVFYPVHQGLSNYFGKRILLRQSLSGVGALGTATTH